jgi:hypothetical protein
VLLSSVVVSLPLALFDVMDRPSLEFLQLARSVYSIVYDVVDKNNHKISGVVSRRAT